MDFVSIIPLIALAMPIMTLLLIFLSARHKSLNGYTAEVERRLGDRIEELEIALGKCIKDRILLKEEKGQLVEENMVLKKQLGV